MALTTERAEAISTYLTDDKERAEILLGLSPEEATARINSAGYDFTVEEIEAFGEQLRAVCAQEGELDIDEMEQVSGGIALSTLVGAAFAVKVAYDVGRIIGKNAPW